MKKIISFILSICILTGLSACNDDSNSSSDSSENAVVSSYIEKLPFPDIKISIPADYETVSSEYIDEFYKKGDASIIVTSKGISDSQKNMDNLVYDALYQYNQIADTLTEVSNESFDISGYEARITEIRYSITGEQNTLNMSCCFGFIIGKNTFYIITCSVPTAQYSNYSNEFKEVIKTAVPKN